MITCIGRPVDSIRSLQSSRPTGQDACDLAMAYLLYESACWRGQPARVFALRLGSYWRSELPPVPKTEPDAYSPHGAGGRGIRWFEKSGEVLGYITGCRCGYRIPVSSIAGLARTVPQWPRRAAGAPRTSESQFVIH